MFKIKALVETVARVFLVACVLLTGLTPAAQASAQGDPVREPLPSSQEDISKGMTLGIDSYTSNEDVPILSEEIAKQAQEIVEDKPLQIELAAEPAIYTRGKPIIIKWKITGGTPEQRSNLTIIARPPDGVLPVNKADEPEADGSVIVSPNSPAGSIVWKVLDYAEFPLTFTYELVSNGDIVNYNTILIGEPLATASAGRDTRIKGYENRVSVNVPASASRSPLLFDIRPPSPNALPGASLSWHPVEIIAVDGNSQKNVTKFDTPITIQIAYDETEIFDWDERSLSIYYYDPETMDWFPMETEVDTENNTLTAQSDHLTVFDYQANNWQSYMVPTVDSFKTSDFTGAGTYQINLWTPPGPGGLQPSVVLSYNSQIIDESSAYQQASWVGMGWDLDPGMVTRNLHGTDDDWSDDTFSISVGGISSQLLPISVSGEITQYNTADQSFMKVEGNNTTYSFTAWTKEGTKYEFTDTTDNNYNKACVVPPQTNNHTWRWGLTKVTDTNGNTIEYTYQSETKPGCANEVAVYPKTITYGNYQIEFIRENRTDYQTSWTTSSSRTLYGTKRLKEVQIKHNGAITKRYAMSYAPNNSTNILPNFNFSAGGKTLTLVGVQEFDAAGNALPAVTFTYADYMHLTTVNNGQGGSVTMNYAIWWYFDDINKDLRSVKTTFQTGDCINGPGPSPTWSQVSGKVRCDNSKLLQVGDVPAVSSVGERAIPQHMVKPSARYTFLINVRAIQNTTSVSWGIRDTGTNQTTMVSASGITTTGGNQEKQFTMPVTYNPAVTKLRLVCSNCFFRSFEVSQFVILYRVTSRTVTVQPTGLTSTYTYQYDNASPATNDNSAAVATGGTLYTKKLREFRGHAMSQVTGPNGLTTVNWFWQADGLKGRAYDSLVLERTFFDGMEALNSNWVASGGTHTAAMEYQRDFDYSIKSTNPNADWNVVLSRSLPSNNDTMIMVSHIRLSGTDARGIVGIEGGRGKIQILMQDGSATLNSGKNNITLLSSGNFLKDEWYAVTFIKRDRKVYARIWQLDNPNNYGEASIANFELMAFGLNFHSKVYNGSIYTDSYFEGVPYSQTITRYQGIVQYDTTTGNGIPDLAASGLMPFKDLTVTWVRTNSVESRNYNGDASFVGTKQEYTYASQYGNLLSQIESGNDGSGWAAYRKTDYEYYPNVSATKYIVGLPARQTLKDAGDTLLAETLYFYDGASAYTAPPAKGDLTTQRAWAGGTDYAQTSFTYDPYGNPLTQSVFTEYGTATSSPPASTKQTTTTAYDTAGYNTYPVSVTNELGHTVNTAYNYALGLPVSVTDANNVTTTATYDGFGRLKTITAPGDTSPTLSVTYHDTRIPFQVDLVQTVSASSTIRISRFYDGAGRQIQSQTANAVVDGSIQNVVVDTQYNNLGQTVKTTAPYTVAASGSPSFVSQTFSQPYTSNTYDVIGRVLSVTAPNQTTTTYTYGDLSVAVRDPKNITTTTTMDAWGRTTYLSANSGYGPNVAYSYDVLDRLTYVYHGRYPNQPGQEYTTTHIEYDVLGRKVSMSDPDMGYWEYEYDALGNLKKQTDANLQTICLYYDGLNRLDGKIYSANGGCGTPVNFDVDFDYDSGTNGIGKRASMSDASGSTAWTYDLRGRLSTETKVIDAQSFTTSWNYNSGDLPILMVYPDGETVVYGYNTDGTLKSLISNTTVDPSTGSGQAYLNDMQYDEAGRLKLIQYGNAVINKTFDYFPWNTADMGGLLASTTASAASSLQNLSYTYDKNGNVLTITDAMFGPQTQTFTYDALNRITSAAASGGNEGLYSEIYAYDSATGNLSSKDGITYTYGDAAHKHAVTALSNGNLYQYDANGNMILRDVDGQVFDLVYDDENRLTSVTAQGVQVLPTPTPLASSTVETTLEATLTPSTTPTFTETLTPEDTSTPTETSTPEDTSTPTETSTPEDTPTSTETMAPTETNTPDPSITPILSLTETDTSEPTVTPTLEETLTPTLISSPTETEAPSDTPTPTETATETGTPTEITPSVTPSLIPSPTLPPAPVFANAEFTYDGDGKRVKSVMTTNLGTTTTYFVGTHYEVTGSEVTKYYYAGAQRIAIKKDGVLNFIVGDHLGSTSLVTDTNGTVVSEMRYKAWGEVRHASGSESTKYQYTGQYSYASDFGLHFYNARWYDSYLNHFTQPDSIVPDPYNQQDWNRYSYARNNPVRYNDPTGHIIQKAIYDFDADFTGSQLYGLHFKNESKKWTSDEMQAVLKGVMDVGKKLAEASGCQCSGSEAFKGTFGGTFTFSRSSLKPGWAAETRSSNEIVYYDVKGSPNYIISHPRLTVHELGHAFNVAKGRSPQNSLTSNFLRDADGKHVDETGRYYGFNGGYENWQFGWDNTQSEVFADMFVGWVYNEWDFQYRPDLAALRQNHMNKYMGGWINGSIFHH